jgi:putative spermidine/putrescine transport system permease protein
VKRVRRVLGDWAPAIPFIVVVGGLLVTAAAWLAIRSVRSSDGSYTLQAWRDIVEPGLNRRAILTSLHLAAVVATIAALVGTPLAWFASHFGRRGRVTTVAAMNVAANFGGASLAIAFVSTLGAVGFVRLLLQDWFGITLGLNLYRFWGIVVVYLSFIVPLYALLVLPTMGVVRQAWWEAAQTMGAGRMEFWRRVGGPVVAPFVLGGWVLSFAWSIGQYSVPFALVGADSADPLITLRISALLGSAIGGSIRFQRAAAFSMLLVVITAVALLTYRRITATPLRRLQGAR